MHLCNSCKWAAMAKQPRTIILAPGITLRPRSTAFTQQMQTAGEKSFTASAARLFCRSVPQSASAERKSSRLPAAPPSPNIRLAAAAILAASARFPFASAPAVSAATAVFMPVTESAKTGRNSPYAQE